ncbi:hypothetical protein K505DRAFT_303435 [Melanomma pulvis-pyrius CBS 109.77]|uniref:CCZ1/INTU/HSP4 first Longin domain-containing protein n=1 Tax=Melanomma pulvis-pyrius CBS 109.77 TaxID=1314802 RepID=A0A6A6XDS6_9PLEO|nr:hypothetical protein K505DRAFT_303435 [Melanomma pulvis-pyrius CBS 109.77]
MSSTAMPKVVPAQLSFLAIYNPALGTTDETFHHQIVFYYSKAARVRSKIDGKDTRAARDLREQENEKLRQVGLAQGMVGFARSFSNGAAVDSVETQKSRIVLHELEDGWWILASIDLTQLPASASSASKTDGGASNSSKPGIEYSSREVSPPALLLQQLTRAYSVFLLHHGSTLNSLFAKLDRPKFCNILDKFWTRFANSWDVLLHGSPAVDIFGGLKLAAGGELGMGVGEEEWGSGERDVLEDYARRTLGLVDIIVSRFGEPSPLQYSKDPVNSKAPADVSELEPWIGSGKSVNAYDGVVFSGVGALSRRSLRDMSHWIESIYCYGDHAYGVVDNPSSDRRKRRRRKMKPSPSGRSSPEAKKVGNPPKPDDTTPKLDLDLPPIPPPIVAAAESSLDKASAAVDAADKTDTRSLPAMASLGDAETWMKYLTLGYGSAWGGKKALSDELTPTEGIATERGPSPEASMRYVEPKPDVDHAEEKLKTQIQHENNGYFIIGLKGNMEDDDFDDENDEGSWNNRIPLRTVYVDLSGDQPAETPSIEGDDIPSYEKELSPNSSLVSSGLTRLRPVIYVHRPFIYTFLFKHRTETLTLATFYRDLHTYFSPLHRPLSNSTSPDKVAIRIAAASHPHTTISSTTNSGPNTQPIYDLVYDPRTLTVHSSLPNIPEPGTLIAEGISSTTILSDWSRVEALNVHSQILTTVSSTRRSLSEIERTCKTSRGWWVVWMRLPPSHLSPPEDAEADSEEFNTADLREAFLVRRARDTVTSSAKNSGSRMGSGLWRLGVPSTGEKMGGSAAGWGPRGLAEGIGIDARRYVEGLLSLNR